MFVYKIFIKKIINSQTKSSELTELILNILLKVRNRRGLQTFYLALHKEVRPIQRLVDIDQFLLNLWCFLRHPLVRLNQLVKGSFLFSLQQRYFLKLTLHPYQITFVNLKIQNVNQPRAINVQQIPTTNSCFFLRMAYFVKNEAPNMRKQPPIIS